MKNKEQQPDGEDGRGDRMALGVAIGTPLGVALSLVLDNWGMLGVGIALGIALGAMLSSQRRGSCGDETHSQGG
jgi:hypothetical protein